VGKLYGKNAVEGIGIGGRIILDWILKEADCEGVDRIHLAQDRIQWWAPVNTVMNLLVLYYLCDLTSRYRFYSTE